MFKRIAVLSFLLMYLGTTVGFAMSLHFCGTNLSEIQINQDSKKPCCADETKTKTDNCCEDKHIDIKVSDQQQNISFIKLPIPTNFKLFLTPLKITTVSVLSSPYFRLGYRVAPNISNIPLTIQNCRFQI